METHFLMDISNGRMLYEVFFILSFLVIYAILIFEGCKRKFPLLSWVLLLMSAQLASIIGTKLFSYSWNEWQFMFRNHLFLPNTEKSLLGSVLLASATFLTGMKLLRFRYPVWDSFAVAFPVGMAFITTGCFLYGCCFGQESYLPWAVQYPVMSLAHYHQFNSGILTSTDLYSLPVHPVQLYATIGGILVAVLVIRFRRHWKAEGSLLLFSVILFLLMRFAVDFFRDPFTNKFGGQMFWILKIVQWQFLAGAILAAILLLYRERTYKPKQVSQNPMQAGLRVQAIYFLSLVIVFVMMHNWFRLSEIIAVNIALLPALYIVSREFYLTLQIRKYKWIYACSLLLPLFLMSQTLPETETDTSATKYVNTFHTIGAGFASGEYTDIGSYTRTNTGCGPALQPNYFSQKYSAGGTGYSLTRETADRKEVVNFGANLMFGEYTQFRQSDSMQQRIFLFGVNPFIRYDTKWIGIGGGLHLGNLAYTQGDRDNETLTLPEKNYFKTPIFPQFYFRIGPQRFGFADIHIADQFPVSSPGMAFLAGVGSGFGIKNGFTWRFGMSFLDNSTYYMSIYWPIKNKIVLEPFFLWPADVSTMGYPVNIPEYQFSVGISYRFAPE
jgi:prolipoprotein diacylglyceryltransferase